MKVTRIIHPIGQGGFYTETLNDGGNEITVVYDCGGNTEKFMNAYIDSYLPTNENGKKKVIDAVFISHLHADHVNGLDYLLEKTTVKNLILPQLTESVVLEAYLYNYITTRTINNISNQFLLNLYNGEGYDKEINIIKIEPNNNDRAINGVVLSQDDDSQFDFGFLYSTNTDLTGVFHIGNWLYIPYNPPVSHKSDHPESFYEYFKDELVHHDFLINELPDLCKTIKMAGVRKVYKKYFGTDHNAYSMTLFSGLKIPNDCHSRLRSYLNCDCCRYHCPEYHCECNSPNILYTGDFEPNTGDSEPDNNMNKLMRFYGNYWRTIGTIQVPHHGSRNNFNPELYSNACCGIVSVGRTNKYHHPNIDTLINIRKEGCCPRVTTEDFDTMQVYKYDVK